MHVLHHSFERTQRFHWLINVEREQMSFDRGDLDARDQLEPVAPFRPLISSSQRPPHVVVVNYPYYVEVSLALHVVEQLRHVRHPVTERRVYVQVSLDRKSTRLNSSHDQISYAV